MLGSVTLHLGIPPFDPPKPEQFESTPPSEPDPFVPGGQSSSSSSQLEHFFGNPASSFGQSSSPRSSTIGTSTKPPIICSASANFRRRKLPAVRLAVAKNWPLNLALI